MAYPHHICTIITTIILLCSTINLTTSHIIQRQPQPVKIILSSDNNGRLGSEQVKRAPYAFISAPTDTTSNLSPDLAQPNDEDMEEALKNTEKLLHSSEHHDEPPHDLVLYTAKIINLLRLKRGFSVISRLFPHLIFPSSSRRRASAYQQRAVNDDYFEQDMQTRRTPLRQFRPRLRWG